MKALRIYPQQTNNLPHNLYNPQKIKKHWLFTPVKNNQLKGVIVIFKKIVYNKFVKLKKCLA